MLSLLACQWPFSYFISVIIKSVLPGKEREEVGQEAGAGSKAGCVWACGWEVSGKEGASKCLLAIRLPFY